MTRLLSHLKCVDRSRDIPISLPPFVMGGRGDSNTAPRACRHLHRAALCAVQVGVWLQHSHNHVQCRQAQRPSPTPTSISIVMSEKVENISIFLPPFWNGGRGDSTLAPEANSAGSCGFDTSTKSTQCGSSVCGFDTCINTCSAGKLSHRIGLQLPSHLSCINKAGNIPGLPPPFVKGGRGDSTPAQKSCSPGRLP